MSAPLHISTPLLESRPLSIATGRAVWLKMEALQPSGSFKLRGIGLACQSYQARGARRFVSSSGGNAGLAVAYAGRQLGVPVTVVVPQTTTARALDLLRLEGAEVIVHGASWQEAHAHALALLDPAHDAMLHPFDDPLLWQGHASMVDEVAAAGLVPDAVVLAVGGGGLLSGVAEGMRRHGWDGVPILAVETTGAASFHAATLAGRPVPLERIDSVATSLGAGQVCEQAVQWWRERPVRSLRVSDASALRACEQFLEDHRVLVEPACGAALAAVYDAEHADALAEFQRVLVIVCGGATATLAQIQRWQLALTTSR